MSENPWQTLRPGETWQGLWESGAAGRLPVLAARGTRPGPTLLVTGGVHGDEYEGPAAIHAFFDGLHCGELSGRVIGLPVVTMAAWEARSRCAPGQSDLNRAFLRTQTDGAKGTGGAVAALAALVFDVFVLDCDVLWDLHSGGSALVHLPLAGWYGGGSGEAEHLARGSGAGLHPWLIPDVPGVLSYEAHRIGKVAVGAEWGGGGRLDSAGVRAYTQCLQAVLEDLKMSPPLENAKRTLDTRTPIAGDYQTAPAGGLFFSAVSLGDTVLPHAELGLLCDVLGMPVCRIEAARSGIVAGLPSLPWLRTGERVAYIG